MAIIKALYEGKKSYWSPKLPPTKEFLTVYYLFKPDTIASIPMGDNLSFIALQIPKDAIIAAKPVGQVVDFESSPPGGKISKLVVHEIELKDTLNFYIVYMKKQGSTFVYDRNKPVLIANINSGILKTEVDAQATGVAQDNYINCSVSRPPCY